MPFGVFIYLCRCITCWPSISYNRWKVSYKSFPMVLFVVLNLEIVMSYGCLNFWLGGEMPIFWDNEMLHSKNRRKSAFQAAAFSFYQLMDHECGHLLKS